MLCAAHCALLPLLVAFLPALALEPVESALLIASMLLAVFCHALGFRIHGRGAPVAVVICGLALVLASRWAFESPAEFLTIGGALVMASSHWLNSRFCATCPKCARPSGGG
jgi:hypothetical protein